MIRAFNRAASCDFPDAACSNSLRGTSVGKPFHSLTSAAPRIPGHDAQHPASRRFHTARATIRRPPRLPRPNGRERWPRLLPTSVERIHLRSFHRWRDRRTVWGSSSLVGLPNDLQLFHELVCVGLGFPPCCKGIERCISHLHVLGNAPSIAATLPGVLCDFDCEERGRRPTSAPMTRALSGRSPTRSTTHR